MCTIGEETEELKPPPYARGILGPKRKRGEIPDRPLKQGQVWKYLKEAFVKAYPLGHIVRIEDSLGRGVPDVYFRIGQLSGWIEIKTGYQKPTDIQAAWHKAERLSGGYVMVVTVRPDRVIVEIDEEFPVDLGVCSWAIIVAKLRPSTLDSLLKKLAP